MRTVARTHRPSPKAGSNRPAASRVQAKARPAGAGNHRRQHRDSFERQADEIARRIIRGEKNLGRHVTPAPAAGFHCPESRGASLPRGLKEELETAFGAELSAVRIHTGAAADSAAREFGAEAFASGNDIYFGAGRFAPHRADGKALLAHELTHVLQQTGRLDSENRLAATLRSGPGQVQCTEIYHETRPFPEAITLTELIAIHRAAAPAEIQTSFDTLSATLQAIVGNTLNAENAGAAELSRRVLEVHEWDGTAVPGEHRAVVCDVLKAMRQPVASGYLLAHDPLLRTIGHQEAVFQAAVTAHRTPWETAQLRREPLRSYYPWQFVDTYRRLLFGPTRAIPSLEAPGEALGDFVARTAAVYTAGAVTGGLVENELYYSAFESLTLANQVRLRNTETVLTAINDEYPSLDPAQKRSLLAIRLHGGFTALSALAPENALHRMIVGVSASILAVAARAIRVWRIALHIAAPEGTVDPELTTLWPAVATRPEFQPLRTGLQGIARNLFALDHGNLPSAAAYSAAIERAKTQARLLFYNQAEARLIQLARAGDDDFAEHLTIGFAYLLTLLPAFIAELNQYRYREDTGATGGRNDLRIASRIRVARWLQTFATTTGWDEFATLAGPVITATETATMNNQLALLADWSRDTEASIADFSSGEKGFASGTPIRGMGMLTSWHIATMFLIGWYEHATAVFDAALSTQENDFSTDRGSIMSQVQAQLQRFSKPRRFTIGANQYIAAHPGAGGTATGGTVLPAASRISIYDLAAAHPRTLALETTEQVPSGDPLSVDAAFSIWPLQTPASGQELYFWIVPPLQPIVRHLQAIPELDLLVRAELERARAAETTEAPPAAEAIASSEASTASWVEWILALERIGPESLARFGGPLSTDLRAESGGDRDAMIGRIRRVNIHDRKILSKFHVRPLLEAYNRHNISTYTKPDEAQRQIERFVAGLQPGTDRDPQLAIILLELLRTPVGGEADLLPIFSRMERYDLIIIWQALFRSTLQQVSARRASLEGVQTAAELADTGWINAAVVRMQEVVNAMEEVKRTVQVQFGFVATRTLSATEPAALSAVGSGGRINADQEFTIDGVVWKLLEVLEDFEFHPDYGQPGTGAYTPSLLKVNNSDVSAEARAGEHATARRPLLRVIRNGVTLVVHENDDALLEEISHAVGMQVIVQNLEELGAFIENAATTALELAEFIPGAGQAVMAARLATSIIAFIASDEFEEIKEAVFQDPMAVFAPLREIIAGQHFEPDQIVEWLLLGGGLSSLTSQFAGVASRRPRSAARTARPRARTRSGTIGRFAGLIERVWRLGAGLGRSLGRARGRARRAFLGVETFVMERPILVLAFRFAGDHLEQLESHAATVRDAISGDGTLDIAEQISGLGGQLGEIIEAVNHLEIPQEIVPLDQLLELIINLILDRLGAKYRLAGRAILVALNTLGLKQDILRAVTDQIPPDFDPNHHWGVFVRETLQPRFDEFRTQTIDSFTSVLTRLGLPGFEHATVAGVALEPHGVDFPESEASPDDEPELPLAGSSPLTPHGGQPLPASLRSNVETRFGHDFSHVRLHTAGDAAPVTSRFGAEGLTTGSHVYLQPGLSPAYGRGAQVMRHELTHVLQQTGPRPLGGRHAATPRTGRPRRGLVVNPAREHEAEAMARAAGRPGAARIGSDPDAGLQPSLGSGTVGRLMRRLSRGEGLLEYYHGVGAHPGTATVPAALAGEVGRVGSALWSLITSGAATLLIQEPFDRVRAQIGTYFRGQVTQSGFQAVVNRLASESLVLRNPATGTAPAGGGAAPAPVSDLNVRAFRTAIEGELLAMGFGTRIEFKGAEAEAPGGRRRFRITDSDPIERLRIVFLFMPPIAGGAALWDELMRNTFSAASGSADRNRLQPRVRAWLAAKGIVPGLWASRSFELSVMAKAEIAALMATGGTPLAANELPSKAVYLNPAPTQGPAFSTVGYVGLHLGRYNDPAQSRSTKGRERESHHTTQFLLLEYFRNWKDEKPFRHDAALYPGLSVDGAGNPSQFANAAGALINIRGMTGDTESARGPQMPAISLAAVTHSPSIHIQAEKDDALPAGSSRPAQGYSVQNHFRNALASPDVRTALFSASDADLRTLVEPHSNPRRSHVQNEIFTAMQATYAWMRTEMFERLRPGLDLVETAYYNDLSQQTGGPQDQLNEGDMGTVIARARTHNDTLMEHEGWRG